jgi:hypothetical protein
MPLITEQISNLINGVSQQPPSLRLASQGEVQENGLVTVAEGLKKRPPLEHVTKLNNKTDTDAKVHFIDRDEDERYVVTITSDQFDAAFSSDFTGTEMELFHLTDPQDPWDEAFGTDYGSTDYNRSLAGASAGETLDYITTTDARDNLRLFTVADFTFLLNKTVTTAKSSTLGDSRDPEGLVFIKQASNATTFSVFLNGVSVGAITNSNDADTLTTNVFNAMNAVAGFTCTKFGSSNIYVTRADGADFTLNAQAPEANMVAIKDTVVDFTDLPARTKDGFTIKVVGDPGSTTDDYWITHSNQSDQDVGEWIETVEPGLANTIDPATMPINMIRAAPDPWDDAFSDDFGRPDFSLAQIEWTDRVAGDLNTAPDPTFIGEKINDMSFHKNRFGFLANENLILSELGEFFNFYATTATDLLDTDMIDLASPTNEVSILQNFVPFNEDLVAFSDKAQFKLTEFAAGGLTPTNAKLSLLTQYEHEKLTQPVVSGRKIYFTEDDDGFSILREFGIVEDLQEETAEDITSHIPSYIKGKGFEIIPHDDFLFVLADENLNEVFTYKFLFQQGQKKLSSWGKWKLKPEEKVIGMKIIDHIAYFVIVRPDGTYLDKMSLQDANLVGLTESSTQLPFKIHLDRLTEVRGEYQSETNVTTWTVPYPDNFGSTFRVVLGPMWSGREGALVQGVTQTNTNTTVILKATGDFSAQDVFIGKEYSFVYEFTEPTIKTEVQGRLSSLAGGILKIRKFNVDYFKTGFFKMRITATGRDAFDHVFTGRILGSPLNTIGDIPFETGNFKKLILSDAKDLKIELLSDSYLPCAFTGADWEGNYVVRTVGRR